MSSAHVLGHLVRRGIVAAHDHVSDLATEHRNKLHHCAALYDNSAPALKLHAGQLIPVIITGFITLLLIASIRYTTDVIASLAMIESPSSAAMIQPREAIDAPPAYSDERDAPLEKAPLTSADRDVEITIVKLKPITSKISTTIHHLTGVGGFRARWRGLGISMLYHGLHAFITNTFASFLGTSIVLQCVVYVFTSLVLARVHLLWTHTMIAYPSSKPFYRRIVARKQCRAIMFPTLVFALAQLATFLLPIAVAVTLRLPFIHKEQVKHVMHHKDCAKMTLLVLRFLAVPATALVVSLSVLLPAAVTLARIEAALLPEDEKSIVPFDREAIVGTLDLADCKSSKTVFVQAWRSVDRSARLRVVRLYVKMAFAQATVAFVGLHVMAGELYLIGPEKIKVFVESGVAQLKLAVMETYENGKQ